MSGRDVVLQRLELAVARRGPQLETPLLGGSLPACQLALFVVGGHAQGQGFFLQRLQLALQSLDVCLVRPRDARPTFQSFVQVVELSADPMQLAQRFDGCVRLRCHRSVILQETGSRNKKAAGFWGPAA